MREQQSVCNGRHPQLAQKSFAHHSVTSSSSDTTGTASSSLSSSSSVVPSDHFWLYLET